MIKKSLIALSALITLGLTGHALAYENLNAGYSIKDKDPFFKVVTAKIYGYTELQANKLDQLRDNKIVTAHVIDYYTKEEMDQILEESYSDEYFNKEYDKLVALKKADISLVTVPTKLVEIERYNKAIFGEEQNVVPNRYLEKMKNEVKPVLRIDEFQGRKAITSSYKFEQNKAKFAIDVTYMTANNNLYQLISYTQDISNVPDTEIVIKDDGTLSTNDKEDIVTKGDLRDKVTQSMAIKNLKDSDLGEAATKQYWKKHTNFVKIFKTFTPASVTSKQAFGYYDNVRNQKVVLPDDWGYAQYQIRENEANGNFTFAGSIPSIKRMAKALDTDNMMAITGLIEDEIFDDTEDVKSTDEDVLDKPMTPEEQAAYAEKTKEASLNQARKILKEFDSALVSTSFKANQSDFYDMLIGDATNEFAAELFLSQEIPKIRKYQDEYFKFNSLDYKYDLSNDKNRVSLRLDASVNLIKEFDFNSVVKIMAAKEKNLGSMLLYVEKPDFDHHDELNSVVDHWNF